MPARDGPCRSRTGTSPSPFWSPDVVLLCLFITSSMSCLVARLPSISCAWHSTRASACCSSMPAWVRRLTKRMGIEGKAAYWGSLPDHGRDCIRAWEQTDPSFQFGRFSPFCRCLLRNKSPDSGQKKAGFACPSTGPIKTTPESRRRQSGPGRHRFAGRCCRGRWFRCRRSRRSRSKAASGRGDC